MTDAELPQKRKKTTTPKVRKRLILDELEVSGAHYVLALEFLSKKRLRAAIYHAPRANLSDRLHCPLVWRQRPHLPAYLPFCGDWHHTKDGCEGRKRLFAIGADLLANAKHSFKIRGGWQEGWDEVKCGGQGDGQSLETWRMRSLDLLKMHLGDRTRSEIDTEDDDTK